MKCVISKGKELNQSRLRGDELLEEERDQGECMKMTVRGEGGGERE